jgi:uncharacterized protein (TIGR03437 family)
VSLFGSFGVGTQVDEVRPIPATLGGVQVLVNGQAAPVYLVSENQISALIPYEVAGEAFATFQVVVNGSNSNPVTLYVNNSAPGLYTASQNGIGAGAFLHSNFTKVTDSSPAVPGETVLLYMNGLGTVTPQVADGAAGAGSPLSFSDDSVFVALDDGVDIPSLANVTFAGLSPGFAGLYQVNFTLPTSGLKNGDVYVGLGTNEAYNVMATIHLSGFPETGALAVPGRSRRPSQAIPAVASRGKHAKNFRRALPERPKGS